MRWTSAFILTLVPAIAGAQVMPTLSGTATFTLALPYLEYLAPGATTRNGFSVNLKTSDLITYTLDATSLKTQTAFSNAANAPQISLSGTQFLLTIPYLSVSSGGTDSAYSVALTSKDLLTYSLNLASLKALTVIATPSAVAVANVNTSTVGTTTFSSSTKLAVSWKAPTGYTPNHYRIYASETIGNTNVSTTALASDISATLTGLKSATTYAVVVKACKDSACEQAGTAVAVSGKTSEEVWRVQGKGIGGIGHTWSEAQEVVSDSNTKAWAFAYGSGAGSGLEGTVRLYYDPDFTDPAQKGVKIGATTSAATTSPLTVNSFTAAAGYGLRFSTTSNYEIATSQPVPLSAAMGGKIRLFFEFGYNAPGNKVGVYYLDSQDGYTGLDYNKGSATVCSTDAEFAVGGNCAPTRALGDSSGIDTARQFKIGYPILTDWRWNGESGTFMAFSMNTANGACSTNSAGVGYAQWDGSKWVVSNTSGCPKFWEHMQAPVPVHLGGAKYKMYYGHTDLSDRSDATCTAQNIPGTKKILYADGAVSGNAGSVEFEDWEDKTYERDMTFLWPDGTAMDSCNEKKIDDFVVYMPTFSTDFQVMYMVNADSWLGMAVLLNP